MVLAQKQTGRPMEQSLESPNKPQNILPIDPWQRAQDNTVGKKKISSADGAGRSGYPSAEEWN